MTNTPAAWVTFGEGDAPALVLEIQEYASPDSVYPNGRVLAVGAGECPLWFDLSRIVLRWTGRPCPGDCNRAWRKAQTFLAEREQLLMTADHRTLTAEEDARLTKLSIAPRIGEPVWCQECQVLIHLAVRRMPDLASWLWSRGHDGADIDLGRLSVVRSERGSSVKGSPSLSPSWDAVEELVTWAAAVEDKARGRLGVEAREADWWAGTQSARETFLSTSVLWILARREIWSLPEAERWGREALRLTKRAEKLSGRDQLVHHLGRCPNCDRKALIRVDGEDVVHCQSCRRRWTEDEYQWLVRTAVAAAKEGTHDE